MANRYLQASGVVQFTLVRVGLGVGSADLVTGVDQASTPHGRVQAVGRQLAAGQAGLATVHGHDLDGLPLRTNEGERDDGLRTVTGQTDPYRETLSCERAEREGPTRWPVAVLWMWVELYLTRDISGLPSNLV